MNDSGNLLDYFFQQQQNALSQGMISFDLKSDYDPLRAPWIVPPSGFLSFDENNAIPVPAIGTTATILSFQVPDGFDGIIKRISQNYLGGGFSDGSGDLIWRITLDGRPVKNYSNMIVQLGATATPREISGIRIQSGQIVGYTVTHVNNPLPDNTVATAGGWYYPRMGE